MPWLQLRLNNRTNIMGVVISTPNKDGPNSHGGNNFRNVEIRAGLEHISSQFRGQLTVNTVCGKFKGPGINRRAYLIVCDENIEADFVTVQILDDNATLSINELEIISDISTGRQCSVKHCDGHKIVIYTYNIVVSIVLRHILI